MSDIQVSLYGSCNRPHLWKWYYETVSMNKVNFEIIFVSNVMPDFELPSNFKVIYSPVKPSQCNHIAAMNCRGEVLQHVGDDCQNSPYGLDKLYELYKKQNDYKCIVAPKFYSPSPELGGSDVTDFACRLVHGDTSSVPLHHEGIMSNKFYCELGGFDNRFVFPFVDLDLQVRAYTSGGKIIYREDAWYTERKDLTPNWQQSMYYKYNEKDHELLMSLWFENGKFINKRTSELQPFIQNETLLTISQGTKGHWN